LPKKRALKKRDDGHPMAFDTTAFISGEDIGWFFHHDGHVVEIGHYPRPSLLRAAML
jgi:hypothetical protein